MDHVAIMKSSLGFLEKIIQGTKTIESRWYTKKITPWNKIAKGDSIYFKNTGAKITHVCNVEKVLQFEDINPKEAKSIISSYGTQIGLLTEKEKNVFIERVKNKKYAVLIFLSKPKSVTPFSVNKKSFGAMSAWLVIDDINKIKE